MCDVLLTTEAELATLAEKIPAVEDGYTQAALYGLRSKPSRVELFHPHDEEPTVYIRNTFGQYNRREIELDF